MLDTWKRLSMHKLAVFGLVVLVLFVLAALLAPWITPHDPYAISSDAMLASPSAAYLLGADQLGRDILSRILYGARIAFMVGLISVAIALIAGTAIGVTAAYCGGAVDFVLSRFIDMLFSIPDILLALAIMAILGPSTTNLMIAVGIVYTPIFARIARGSTLSVKEAVFIEAARSIGVKHATIIRRHVLPGILAPLMVQTTLSFAFAILAEAALSFLGLGAEPDTPSWGVMLNQGKDLMEQAWWIAVFPGIAITLAVFSFNVLGDGLRDALDPQLKHEAT